MKNLQYAADAAAAILPAYEAALGVPYPLEKLDLVAIPDFSAGAMENWGEIQPYKPYCGRLRPECGKLAWERTCPVWRSGRPLASHLQPVTPGTGENVKLVASRNTPLASSTPLPIARFPCRRDHVSRDRPAGQPQQLAARSAIHHNRGGARNGAPGGLERQERMRQHAPEGLVLRLKLLHLHRNGPSLHMRQGVCPSFPLDTQSNSSLVARPRPATCSGLATWSPCTGGASCG